MAALAERLRTELLPVARPDDRVGIGIVPGGAEGYADAVARHTTTELTPARSTRSAWTCSPSCGRAGSRSAGGRSGRASSRRSPSGCARDRSLRFDTSAQIVDVAEQALQRAQAAQDEWFPRSTSRRA